jgi:hypothetical protein
MGEIVCFHATDAKRSNLTSKLIELDRAYFYNWGQEHYRFHRGRALVFHDDPHICQAYSLGECFKGLDYAAKIFSTDEIMTEIGIFYINVPGQYIFLNYSHLQVEKV